MGTNETTVHLSGHQGAIYDAFWDDHSETWLTAGGDGIVAEWPRNGKGEGRALLHHEKAFFAVSAHEDAALPARKTGSSFGGRLQNRLKPKGFKHTPTACLHWLGPLPVC
jgi:hypothetical protein